MPVKQLLVAAVLVIAACKKDPGNKTKPAGSGSSGSGSGSGSGMTAIGGKPDCATILTIADIATACELDSTVVVLEAPDDADPSLACQYSIRINGRVGIRFALDWTATAEAAKAKLTPPAQEVTDVAIGDTGQFIVTEGMAWMNHDLEVVKGRALFTVKMPVSEKTGAPCSDDGVVAIGKAVAARLP